MISTIQNQYQPDYVSSPGETLEETLEHIGMTQVELSERTGLHKKTINEIIKGKAPLTAETALILERVLGVPAGLWNNLERNYREWLARQEEQQRLAAHVDWLKCFPLKEMIKFGFVQSGKNKIEQVGQLLSFFGIAAPEQWQEIWDGQQVAYRQSQVFQAHPQAVSAWLRQGEIEAQKIQCAPYNATQFRAALDQIRTLTTQPPETFVPEMQRLCAAAGVAVVFVPELPGTRTSGATKWLTSNKALIQLSLRHKTDDHLWFTFFHEAGHILLHGKKDVFLEGNGLSSEKETEADNFASAHLIPHAAYREFTRYGKVTLSVVDSFARQIGIAPGIVVGRLQHEGILEQHIGNKLKRRFTWVLPKPC